VTLRTGALGVGHVRDLLRVGTPRRTSRRAASISIFMSASANAIAWWSMIGRPNCSRWIAYS
jgi:hypothetical protein